VTPVFADMYYWLALINPRDQAHEEALTLSQSLSEPLLTTVWVLTEVGDAMHGPANRPTFVRLLQSIAIDPQTTVIPAEQRWFDRGVVLFGTRLDKKWSLTDCISFVVMAEMGLTEALTGDSDFVQAGFRKLMTQV
jgi:predicted nucleic acid-binding protein